MTEKAEEGMKYFLYLAVVVGISILLYFHTRVSLTRYFDADEFAHLHWGYAFLKGEMPYRDFFYLFPPLFLYPVAFIISIVGRSFQAILAVRIFILIVYLGVLLLLWGITKRMRGTLAALLAVFIFVFLPMPQDKMMEVRPDLIALFFALLGMYLFILTSETGKKRQTINILYLLSGLSYGLSLICVPKTIFFLIPVGCIWIYRIMNFIWGREGSSVVRSMIFYATGMLIPALFVLGFAWKSGEFALTIYSMTKMASDVTKILGQKFYMFPSHFFWPVDAYYGFGGFNPALIVTLFIFLISTVIGILRGVASFSYKEKGRCLAEFLIFGSFYVSLFAFIKIFPLKHAQYWIPVVPFFCFYLGDVLKHFLSGEWRITNRELIKNRVLRSIALLLFIAYFTYLGASVYQKKLAWTYADTKSKMEYFLKTIPENETVLDLTGETVFFRDAYYFCCVPYGQYEEGIGFDIPDIAKEMEKNKTRYVHIGYEGRLGVLPPGQQKYIRENFEPSLSYPNLWHKKITL